jgi:hypothetical protein
MAPMCSRSASAACLLRCFSSSVLVLAAACTEPIVPAPPNTSTNMLVVSTTTTGGTFDADGFVIRIDGIDAKPIDLNEAAIVQVPVGMHTVELSGVASNCSIANPRRGVFLPEGPPLSVQFSAYCTPDTSLAGIRIVFARVTNDGRTSLIAMNGDGSGRVQLTRDGHDWSPASSPDGKMIAFVRERPDGTNRASLYVMNSNGEAQTRLLLGAYDPSWSPDGRTIAFVTAGGWWGGEIFTVQPDGTGAKLFVQGVDEAASPVFSPDGTLLAFVRSEELTLGQSIWIALADGTNAARATPPSRTRGAGVVWSPDGRRVAYTSFVPENARTWNTGTAWIMALDLEAGFGEVPLLEAKGGPITLGPWAADGMLLFSRNEDVYLLRTADRSVVRLTGDRAGNRTPTFVRSPLR